MPTDPQWRKPHRRCAFTLIEILVVISIAMILVGLLLPAIGRARDHARTTACGTQLHQAMIAMATYAADFRQELFWRADYDGDGVFDLNKDGMDWFAWGGWESGNVDIPSRVDMFNRFVPRPLNLYAPDLKLYQCPGDTVPWGDLHAPEGSVRVRGRPNRGMAVGDGVVLDRVYRLEKTRQGPRLMDSTLRNTGYGTARSQLRMHPEFAAGDWDRGSIRVWRGDGAFEELRPWRAGPSPEGSEPLEGGATPAGRWSLVRGERQLLLEFEAAAVEKCLPSWDRRSGSVRLDMYARPRRLEPQQAARVRQVWTPTKA